MSRPSLLAAALVLATGAAARADLTVAGTFRYVDRTFTFTGGFTGAEPTLPIRLATVQVIDDATSAVLATGATDENGAIALAVAGSGTKNLVVRCFSRSNQFGAQALRVTSAGNVEYSVSSATFAGWDLAADLDVGTVTAQKVLFGGFQGSPFNMLDQMVAGLQYAKSLGAANAPSSLRMIWPGGSGSFASGSTATMADDDGFDDVVQLHEFGHVMHNVYSDSDNPGGSHGFGESDQDPRLSFGEGYASFFAGAVQKFRGVANPGFYMDCSGTGATGAGSIQLRMRFEDGFPLTNTTGGEADEGAVFAALWDVVDTTATNDGIAGDDDALDGIPFANGASGDQVAWNVLVGPVDAAPNATIRDFWNGFFLPADAGNGSELKAAFEAWKMRFAADSTEPNDAPAAASPLTPAAAWSAIRTLYAPAAGQLGPGDGDADFYSFVLTAGTAFDVETRYPNGVADAQTYADPRVTLLRPNGSTFLTQDGGGTGRNALIAGAIADATGTWIARVDTASAFRKTGSYQLRVQVTAGPVAGCTAPVAASASFGAGKAGAGGTPTLQAVAAPVVGGTLTLALGGGPANAAGLLLVGTVAVDLPFDGGHLYVSPLALLPIAVGPSGSTSFGVALANPATCGLSVHTQLLFAADPGAAGFYQTSQSARLTLTFGG